MKKTTILSILSACLFFSCEDVIDVDLDKGETALVVDAWITDCSEPYVVKLATTAEYFNNAELPKVSGAVVVISDNEGNSDTLLEKMPGIYQTATPQKGKIGNTYTLSIFANGENYSAVTEIKRVPPIDSLTFEYKDYQGTEGDGYYLYYHGPEPEGSGDYYRFRITKNDTLQNTPQDLWNIASDDLVDGNYINFGLYDDPLKKGDKMKAEIMSLTQDAFYFFNEFAVQANNGGMFSSPPSNIRTNIRNINPFSKKKAVGYFGASAVNFIEIIVEQN